MVERGRISPRRVHIHILKFCYERHENPESRYADVASFSGCLGAHVSWSISRFKRETSHILGHQHLNFDLRY